MIIKLLPTAIVALGFFVVSANSNASELSVPMNLGIELNQVNDIDKSKCHEDHICYERIEPAYRAIFAEIEEGMGEFVSGTSYDCLSRGLQMMIQKVWASSGCSYPDFDLSTGEATKGCFNEYKFGGGDWSTELISSFDWNRDKIYQIALQKRPLLVPFRYIVTSFYPNDRYKRRDGLIRVVMIYENGDWFIDDIIYANKQTLRGTLKTVIATAK